jgi:hypothetical protein
VKKNKKTKKLLQVPGFPVKGASVQVSEKAGSISSKKFGTSNLQPLFPT